MHTQWTLEHRSFGGTAGELSLPRKRIERLRGRTHLFALPMPRHRAARASRFAARLDADIEVIPQRLHQHPRRLGRQREPDDSYAHQIEAHPNKRCSAPGCGSAPRRRDKNVRQISHLPARFLLAHFSSKKIPADHTASGAMRPAEETTHRGGRKRVHGEPRSTPGAGKAEKASARLTK